MRCVTPGVILRFPSVMRSGRESVTQFFFFFQAEDGIRDLTVTGVQTCALPISTKAGPADAARKCEGCRGQGCKVGSSRSIRSLQPLQLCSPDAWYSLSHFPAEIGRASCRERV